MTTRVDTVEAPLSPSVTSPLPHAGTQPHGRKGDRATPARWTMTRRRMASLAADAAFRCPSTWATNGIGFTCRPSRHNRLPMSFVTVLIDGSTTGIGGQTGLRAALVQPVALLAIRFTSPVNTHRHGGSEH